MAAVSTGNVIFAISADLKSIQGNLKTLESNFNQSFGKIEGIAKRVGGGILTGLIGGLSVSAFAGLIKGAANYADEMGKAAQRTGTTTEFISALAHGAKLADVEFDELTKSIGGFNKNIAEAAKGSNSAKEPFEALGINIRNANGSLKTNEQLLGEVADRFQKMPDGIQKSALAQDLFTKSGAKLIPLLNGGSEGIKQFTAEAQRMGLIVTGEAAAAAEKFNDDLTRLQASAKGVGLAVGGAMVPAFGELTKAILEFINSPGVRDFLGWSAQLMKYWAGNESAVAETRIQAISRQLAGLEKVRASAQAIGGSTAGVDKNIQALNEEKRALELLVDARNQQGEAEARLRQKLAGAKPSTQTFIPEKAAATDKTKNEIDSFFDSLTKQIDTINQKQIELKFGDSAALAAALDAQFARLKEKLGTKIKAFPGLEEFFTQLRDKVVASDESLRRLQETMKQLEGFDLLDASTGSKALEDLQKEAARTAKSLGEQLSNVEKAASLEMLPESERRIEIIRREFDERKKLALDYLAALKESGTTEIQITAETARVNADIAKSSQAAIQKINEENKRGAEEVTEFQRRAWERTADAIADTLNDLTSGQIKSWEDLGKRIQQTITSILNEAAAAEIKKLLLGSDYGRKGGELGGLAKQGADLLASIFGTPAAKPVSVPAFEPSAKHGGMTPVDVLDAEFGKILRGELAGLTSPAVFSAATTQFSAAVAKFAAAVGIGSALGVPGAPGESPDFSSDLWETISGESGGFDAQQPRIKLPPWIVPTSPGQSGQDDLIGILKNIAGQGIQSILETADTAKMGIGEGANIAKAALDVLLQSALAALQAAAASASSGSGLPGMGGGGFDFMSLFGGGASAGGADIFAGGGADFASQGAGGIGSALMIHSGGEVGPNLPKVRFMHSGGGVRSGERMALVQDGEFMMKRSAVSTIGKKTLEFMNATGHMPREESGSRDIINITQNFPNATDADSFRRSRPTYLADLSRAVEKGKKHR
jgi:hypothetical protein